MWKSAGVDIRVREDVGVKSSVGGWVTKSFQTKAVDNLTCRALVGLPMYGVRVFAEASSRRERPDIKPPQSWVPEGPRINQPSLPVPQPIPCGPYMGTLA